MLVASLLTARLHYHAYSTLFELRHGPAARLADVKAPFPRATLRRHDRKTSTKTRSLLKDIAYKPLLTELGS